MADDEEGGTTSSTKQEEREPLISKNDPSANRSVDSSTGSSESKQIFNYFSPSRYWKNIIVVGLGFMLTFSAYGALASLQSTLNYSTGLGIASLCATYIGVIVSGLLAPLIVQVLTVKWTLVVCSAFYALYSVGSIYPAVFTLILAGALLGVAATPFWTAAGTYITTSAIQLADVSGGVTETIINRFNGVFFCFFQTSQVWGNLAASLLLSGNSTDEIHGECGRESCGTGADFHFNRDVEIVGTEELILISIYVTLGLSATLTFIFLLDRLPETTSAENQSWRALVKEHLAATFRLMRSPYLYLLIPLFIYNGAEEAFLGADFTQSYVSCTEGAGAVGYVMIASGVGNAASSIVFGQIEKYTGRTSIIIFGSMIQMALLIGLLLWNAAHSSTWLLMLIGVGWSVGDAALLTQIFSLIGVLFPESQEAAFANFQLWQAVGFAASFALSIPTPVCIYHKLYGFMALLTISLICYIADEYLISRSSKTRTM